MSFHYKKYTNVGNNIIMNLLVYRRIVKKWEGIHGTPECEGVNQSNSSVN